MNSQKNKNKVDQEGTIAIFKSEIQKELKEILSWWSANMVDEENGGFYGRRSGHNLLDEKSDKGIILNTRLLWTFSAVSNFFYDSSFLELANRAYHYLCNHFWDELNSGMIWSVDFQGNPLDTRKQIYAQAFSIYAFSEYYKLTKNKDAIDRATEIFWLIEKYSQDSSKEGYLNAFDRDWSQMKDIRLSDKDANEAKIMNTHLHILEAYTNFHKIIPSPTSRHALEKCINLFLDKFYIPENGSMHIYFDEDWNPKGNHISFGHNIEASWLLWEAALTLESPKILAKIFPVVTHMANAVLDKAIDIDGGICYEGQGNIILDSDKHWWVQAEAVVGFWNASLLTGEEKFKVASINCFRFIQNKIKDHKHGEWFWKVNAKGKPDFRENKAGPWKTPYHNVRMCMEMMKLLGRT